MKLSLKQKIIYLSLLIIIFLVIASQAILYTTKNLDESFSMYTQNAVNGKVAVLDISQNINYISRCTRDIMLGNNYDANIKKIENRIEAINRNFETLHLSFIGTENEKNKLEFLEKTKKTTLAFVDDALKKMKLLKNKSKQERYEIYEKYKMEATPLAVESRKYFKDLSDIKTNGFDVLTEQFRSQIKSQKDFIAITTIIVVFLTIIITMFVIKNILKHLKVRDNLDSANNLLKQYKEAIDITNIVSKTDIHGNITYVNDEFCKVSQFKREELLGKPHNIIRSKDMPKAAFKDLWKTIRNKKVWTGQVKNSKKDGTSYYVDTTIVPILDNHGELSEFIAIRKDITRMVELNLELKETQEDILNRVGMIAETRSEETGFHVRRVAEYCKIIATHLGMDQDEIELLYNASALHDIGKVGTPDDILHKAGKLTQVEFEIMKSHTTVGYHMLCDSKNKIIKTASIIAYEHHEKYDGTGYPKGLKGDQIHIYARITALADVFDALGENRSYKKGWDLVDIIEFINDNKGSHFDPKIVDIFNQHQQDFLYIRKKFRNKDFQQ